MTTGTSTSSYAGDEHMSAAVAEHDADAEAAEYGGPDIIECLQGHRDCPEYDHFEPAEPDPDAARHAAERAASIAALRDLGAAYIKLAGAIEAHDAIPAPYPSTFRGAYILLCTQTAEELAAAARAMPWTLRKEATDKYLELHADLGGLDVQLYAARGKVCKIVGYEDREVEETVRPAVTEKVTRSMPVWECAPLLAADPAASAA
jgi:hypothetical protein